MRNSGLSSFSDQVIIPKENDIISCCPPYFPIHDQETPRVIFSHTREEIKNQFGLGMLPESKYGAFNRSISLRSIERAVGHTEKWFLRR